MLLSSFHISISRKLKTDLQPDPCQRGRIIYLTVFLLYSLCLYFFNRSPCILQQTQSILEGGHFSRSLGFDKFSSLVCGSTVIYHHLLQGQKTLDFTCMQCTESQTLVISPSQEDQVMLITQRNCTKSARSRDQTRVSLHALRRRHKPETLPL